MMNMVKHSVNQNYDYNYTTINLLTSHIHTVYNEVQPFTQSKFAFTIPE